MILDQDLTNLDFGTAAKGMKKGKSAKKQGYDDRLDESLGARHGKKSQSYKARRKESEGMEKAMGRRKYAAVKYYGQRS
jgi:hypothetical protein